MNWVGGFILVLGFLFFLKLFKVVEKSRDVVDVAKASLNTVRDKTLSDLEKEKLMQANALKMFPLFLWISIGSALAVLIPAGVVWLLEFSGIWTLNEVIDLTLSWPFILSSVILSLVVIWIWSIIKRK